MRCERALRMMSAALDDRLGRPEAAELESHLAICRACEGEWQKLQGLDRLFRAAPMSRVPRHFRAQVAVRIDRREQARRTVIGGLALVLGAAALALLLAPSAVGILRSLGIGPALVIGGLETVSQLLILFDAAVRALFVLLDPLAAPLIVLMFSCFLGALALTGLWVTAIRKLRTGRW